MSLYFFFGAFHLVSHCWPDTMKFSYVLSMAMIFHTYKDQQLLNRCGL